MSTAPWTCDVGDDKLCVHVYARLLGMHACAAGVQQPQRPFLRKIKCAMRDFRKHKNGIVIASHKIQVSATAHVGRCIRRVCVCFSFAQVRLVK